MTVNGIPVLESTDSTRTLKLAISVVRLDRNTFLSSVFSINFHVVRSKVLPGDLRVLLISCEAAVSGTVPPETLSSGLLLVVVNAKSSELTLGFFPGLVTVGFGGWLA
ncbi:MAG: hypothetical protein COY80_02610 [Candidatus Pacebacteria bacterium CG_4_10_14_0_8_um_filter_42_14]|nr:MAG: hypothetical protein COY80_02610 [Candidatus Pacebacteria bacterium CG_4_10_14_0_8_um_filter_42_14]